VVVAHIALKLSLGNQGRHRVYDDHAQTKPERTSLRAILSASSPLWAARSPRGSGHAAAHGVLGVQRVLHVDVGARQVLSLRFSNMCWHRLISRTIPIHTSR